MQTLWLKRDHPNALHSRAIQLSSGLLGNSPRADSTLVILFGVILVVSHTSQF